MDMEVSLSDLFMKKSTVTLEPVHTVVEFYAVTDNCSDVSFIQTFQCHNSSFTRTLSFYEPLDLFVLKYEGQELGVRVTDPHDLHCLARRYTGRHQMVTISDGRGGGILVMKKVEASIRRLLAQHEQEFGFISPAATAEVAK